MFTKWFGSWKNNGSRYSIGRDLEAAVPREVSIVLTGAGVPTLRQALPRMSAELDRARRYGRPLAIQLFVDDRVPKDAAPAAIGGHNGNGSGDAAPASLLAPGSALATAMAASVLREIVRGTDIVAYASAPGRCVVFMPEVTAAEARQALHRVGELCASRLAFPIRGGVAAFPENGWTLDELIRHAIEADQQSAGVPLDVTGGAWMASR
jgi:hypothetical protein